MIADQALSSLANLALAVFVARALPASEFGVFGVLFALYVLALMVTRAGFGESWMIMAGGEEPSVVQAGSRHMVAAILVFGCCVGLALGVGALVADLIFGLPDSYLLAGLMVAGAMPWLLVLDGQRFVCFAEGNPGRAVAVDGLWLGCLTAVFVFAGADVELTSSTAAWGVAAVIATLGALALTRRPPSSSGAGEWTRSALPLGGPLAGTVLMQVAGVQLTILIVTATQGLIAGAAVRGLEVLYGPLRVLSSGVALAGLSIAARDPAAGRLRRILVGSSVLLVALAAAWASVLVIIPSGLGEALLGSTWEVTGGLVLIYGLWAVALAPGAAAGIALRARRDTAPVLAVASVAALAGLPVIGLVSATLTIKATLATMALIATLSSVAIWARAWRRLQVDPCDQES